jgi:hypothetical protein
VHRIYSLVHFVFTLYVYASFLPVERSVTEHMTNMATTAHQKTGAVSKIVFWIHKTLKSVNRFP